VPIVSYSKNVKKIQNKKLKADTSAFWIEELISELF